MVAAACSSATTSTGPSPVKCSIALAASPVSLGGGSGSGTVTVTTTPECAWTASSEATWIIELSPSSGQGNGRVEFAVAANSAAALRQSEILVNDARIQVRQEAAACRFEIATRSQSFDATGGTGTVALTASPDGCSWTAASTADWIAVTAGESGRGSASISFSVRANGDVERSAALNIAGQTFTVRQGGAGGSCAYALNPATQSVGAAGGAGAPVAVSSTAGCAWRAASDVDWITLIGGSSGSGNGTVTFSVGPNGGAARTGTVAVAGQKFSVSQAAMGACSFALNPSNQSIGAAGGPGTPVAVSAAAGCAWNASADVPWITVGGNGSGAGNGAIAFSVAANDGPARTGTITVAGQRFTIAQAAALPCSYTINPTSRSVGAGGGTGTVTVSAGEGCTWTGSANEPWIAISAGAAGRGNGTVDFSVAANAGVPRSGTLTVAGQRLTVAQAGACSYAISPTSQAFDEDGGVGTISVSAGAGCGWTAASNEPWITVKSGGSGSGGGTVAFSVLSNSDPKAKRRDGTITVAGRTFTVSQGKK